MKRITIAITFFLLLIVFSSCNEDALLNVQPESLITTASAWETEGMARSNMNGLMNQFRSPFNGDSFLHWFEHRSGHFQFGTSGGGAGTANWVHLFNNTLIAGTSPGTNWMSLYSTINAANLAIKYIPGIEFRNQNEKDRLLAQAYFIRAYTFYALVRIYGDVPVATQPFESVEGELFLSRKPVADVFAQIRLDIDQALSFMPDDSHQNRIRPSMAAVQMLKTDVHLWTAKRLGGGDADLAIAEQAVSQVLQNSNYRLLDDYKRVFRNGQNDEIIFAIYFAIGEQSNQYGNEMVHSTTTVLPPFRNNPVPVASNAQRNAFSDHFVDTYLKKDPADTRLETNFGEFMMVGRRLVWINKFIGELQAGERWFNDDTPIYRYAEAILFMSEVLNARGRTVEAVGYLNMIAERAYGQSDYYSTTLTQAQVDDAILDERLIEFAAEGKSWMDYIRFGKAFERIPSLIGKEGDKEGNVLLFPIAPSTLMRNPNLEQTPGY